MISLISSTARATRALATTSTEESADSVLLLLLFRWRELRDVEGAVPPTPHHSLVVEPIANLRRHREVVVFHGDLVYPEYLVAFRSL